MWRKISVKAQAVSRWLFTAEARVWAKVSTCAICGRHSFTLIISTVTNVPSGRWTTSPLTAQFHKDLVSIHRKKEHFKVNREERWCILSYERRLMSEMLLRKLPKLGIRHSLIFYSLIFLHFNLILQSGKTRSV